MKITKPLMLRGLLVLELLVFALFYIVGSNGIMALMMLKADIGTMHAQVDSLKDEVTHLQSTLVLQQKHPFFQEKIAREQLQMARAEEEIYIYNE